MTTPTYDLWTPAHRANPRPLYQRLREQAPIARLYDPARHSSFWLVSRYEDVLALTRDGRFNKDVRKLDASARMQFFGTAPDEISYHMLSADPPDHTRLRSLVSQAFTPRRVESLRPRIAAVTHELLDSALAQGSADFIDTVAFPLPIIIIAELMGVPLKDRQQFRVWSEAMISQLAADPGRVRMKEARRGFIGYFRTLLEQRRAEPGEDLVSALLKAEQQGDTLSAEELTGMLFLLLFAGHETTVNLLSVGLLALLEHPEQLERLRARPELMGSAVEEMLRYGSPVETGTTRFTTEPVEFRGQVIPPHEIVIAGFMSANHDPAVFAEPERFDVGRTPNKHLGFGFGIHYCLGAALARLEAAVAFELLLARAPRLRLRDAPERLSWRPSVFIRGLEHLPLVFG